MSKSRALIVDDEPDIRERICITHGRMGVECVEAETVTQARALVLNQIFDLCLTDMRLSDGSGLELVRSIQTHAANMLVAVITAHGNVELAVEALKAGAFDFVSKPVELQTLRALVTSALSLDQHKSPADGLAAQMVGDAPAMRETRARIRKLARSQAAVYVSGESGVGKRAGCAYDPRG